MLIYALVSVDSPDRKRPQGRGVAGCTVEAVAVACPERATQEDKKQQEPKLGTQLNVEAGASRAEADRFGFSQGVARLPPCSGSTD